MIEMFLISLNYPLEHDSYISVM